MSRKRIAIAGAGKLARTRGQAFLETGRGEICAVASRHVETARSCAEELGCQVYYDDFHRLADAQPEAILIEVPHRVQDEIALWALENGFDLLIGGCLASCSEKGIQIRDRATKHQRIVEAGYQRRYDPAWQEIHRLVQGGVLGEPLMAVSMALWNPDPQSWYYDQQDSGGMPLTHLSYCYLNALRWILGPPVRVSAAAHRKVETAPGRVREETCAALIEFQSGAFASATASYAGPEGMTDAEPRFLCTQGGVQAHAQSPPGTTTLTVFRLGRAERCSFPDEPSPFVRQAAAFLDAVETRQEALNPPHDALIDVQVAEAISLSAREGQTVFLGEEPSFPGG